MFPTADFGFGGTHCFLLITQADAPRMPLTAEQEVIIRDYVKRYSNIERLTPFRTKQLLKAALSEDKPEPPPADVGRPLTASTTHS